MRNSCLFCVFFNMHEGFEVRFSKVTLVDMMHSVTIPMKETRGKDYLLITLSLMYLSGSQQYPGESGNTHERSGRCKGWKEGVREKSFNVSLGAHSHYEARFDKLRSHKKRSKNLHEKKYT